jgi:hypothetical protein
LGRWCLDQGMWVDKGMWVYGYMNGYGIDTIRRRGRTKARL